MVLHDRLKVGKGKPITDRESCVRGCIALLDASRRYSSQRIKEMIQRQNSMYGWEVLSLRANINAVETAGKLDITSDRAVNYHCHSVGTRLNYEVVGQAVTAVRCSVPLDEHWKDDIEKDFRTRKK